MIVEDLLATPPENDETFETKMVTINHLQPDSVIWLGDLARHGKG
jgi:hypothetical protein